MFEVDVTWSPNPSHPCPNLFPLTAPDGNRLGLNTRLS
jgi:hypothetical protein